jgi:hypothetical protein
LVLSIKINFISERTKWITNIYQKKVEADTPITTQAQVPKIRLGIRKVTGAKIE